MLYHLVTAVGAIVGLGLAWLGIQTLARRPAASAGEPDTLACAFCDGQGGCHCGLRKAVDARESGFHARSEA